MGGETLGYSRIYPLIVWRYPLSLVASLPPGPLAIIGDVHGEFDALVALLERREMGYVQVLKQWRAGAPLKRVPQPERTLVFVGDLVDRGPDSPSVVELVLDLMDAGLAMCIIGNHELNLLRGDNLQRKRTGTGWFHGGPDAFQLEEKGKFHGFRSVEATNEQKNRFLEKLECLPLAAEREDLRVVHACWDLRGIQKLRELEELGVHSAVQAHRHFADLMERDSEYSRLVALGEEEIRPYKAQLKERSVKPPPAHEIRAWIEAETRAQNDNPVKVLTSGPEQETRGDPLFKERWRLHERCRWWNTYGELPVVVGHYWRSTTLQDRGLWKGVDPLCWIGETRRVFCVDYSVGRRYRDRTVPPPYSPATDLGLAALLWPDASTAMEAGWPGPTLVFADGKRPPEPTTDFGGYEGLS